MAVTEEQRQQWLRTAQAMLDDLHAMPLVDLATSRKVAGDAARVAAYGSIDAHTPADYTPKEALAMMPKDKKGKVVEDKEKKDERRDVGQAKEKPAPKKKGKKK